ncbi:MAG TPA: preprotein translocase subunit SecE [Acidimicrobiales bacterium]|nr:preprotein translocase subunit SecE [Acidimicrobiales bacterium]
MNRETKRMMQRQGQMEADGSPATRKPPPGATRSSAAARAQASQQKQRTGIAQFFREVRDELRQVAWPTRAELVNYTAVVFFTLVLMIVLIYLLNLGFAKAILYMFQK